MKFVSIVSTFLLESVCFQTVKGDTWGDIVYAFKIVAQLNPLYHVVDAATSIVQGANVKDTIKNSFHAWGNAIDTVTPGLNFKPPAAPATIDPKTSDLISAARVGLSSYAFLEALTSDPQEKARLEIAKQKLEKKIAELSLPSSDFISAARISLATLSVAEAATSDPQKKARIEIEKQKLEKKIADLSLQSSSPISTEEEQQVTAAVAAAGGTPVPMTTIPATEDSIIDDVNPYVAVASILLTMMMLVSLNSWIRSVTKMRLNSTTAYGYTPIVDQVV
jgi:hypothetical protein